jgi:hypothetical protein
MKRDALGVPLGEPDAAGRRTVMLVSRRDPPRFLVARLAREIEAADAADRRKLETAVAALDREGLTNRQLEALLGGLTGTQARLLMRLAQVGLAAMQGPKASARAARMDELREWIEATRPPVRNVAELRALPDFPKAASRLHDDTLRRRLNEAGITTRGRGRPPKKAQKGRA